MKLLGQRGTADTRWSRDSKPGTPGPGEPTGEASSEVWEKRVLRGGRWPDPGLGARAGASQARKELQEGACRAKGPACAEAPGPVKSGC